MSKDDFTVIELLYILQAIESLQTDIVVDDWGVDRLEKLKEKTRGIILKRGWKNE